MNIRPGHTTTIAFLLLGILAGSSEAQLPNLVLIFIDDMGYADIGPFGASDYATENLDRMAAEGMVFTDFQVSSAVCSASRAALMTGCYHQRIGIQGALGPQANHGLAAREVTLGELFQQKGYATACFGKWHLGHHPRFLPTRNGFDQYFGLPYSNDMWPYHPRYANVPPDHPRRQSGFPRLPLIENESVIDSDVTGEDQKELTRSYTQRAIEFIKQNKDNPFFVYLPHSMVHVPLYVSAEFEGKSGAGLYGDVVMEIDWSVGRILDTLDELDIDENTWVVFTSDNGPWLSYGEHSGSTGPLREGKGTMFEGGSRVPTIMRWSNSIPAGTTCEELAATIDILPTAARLIDAALPEHPIDGKDISSLMFQTANASSPHDIYHSYYANGQLQAVRDPRYKLVFPHTYRSMAGHPGGSHGIPGPYTRRRSELALYDLRTDPGEQRNIADKYPRIVQRLSQAAEQARDALGDSLTDRTGSEVRPADRLTDADERLQW